MKEKINQLLDGEIDIKYLSPPDLISLKIYLENLGIDLSDLLEAIKNNDSNLKEKIAQLQQELLQEENI